MRKDHQASAQHARAPVDEHGEQRQQLACLIEQGIRAPGDTVVGRKGPHTLGVEEAVGLLKCRGIVIVHWVQDPHEQHSSNACQEGEDQGDAAQPCQRRAARDGGVIQSQERRYCNDKTMASHCCVLWTT